MRILSRKENTESYVDGVSRNDARVLERGHSTERNHSALFPYLLPLRRISSNYKQKNTVECSFRDMYKCMYICAYLSILGSA